MDLQDKISMGTALFGSSAIDRGASTALAEVASDAKDGEVTVYMKDENGNEQKITIPCDGDLRAGDTATVIIQEGTATAISASGAGERSKQETATAQETATTAQNTAEDAASAATTAQTTAENAATAATAAQKTAEDAASAASTAKTKAENAATAASTAQTTAENAATAATAAQKTAEDAASAASTAKTKAENAATAASTAQTAAENADKKAQAAADDATSAKNTAETAASDALAAKKTATTAATTAQQASADAKAAADKAEEEAQRARVKEQEIEGLANTASDAASNAVSDAKDAASAAQAAGVSASLAQAAAEAAQGTADETKKYFYHDSEGAHVISGDMTDLTRLDLTNDSLTISEGGAAVSEFGETSTYLNGGVYTLNTLDYKTSDGELYGKSAISGCYVDWGEDYKGKYTGYGVWPRVEYIKGGKEDYEQYTALSADINTDSEGNFSAYVSIGVNNVSPIEITTYIGGKTIELGSLASVTDEIVIGNESSALTLNGATIKLIGTVTINDKTPAYSTDITAEETARTSADNTLQDNIDAEETARTSADNTLQDNIDAEETARKNADSDLQEQIDAIKFDPLTCYPVGSIYMSVNSTSPATLFGGTWAQLKNKFLIGASSNYVVGSTGGSASHSHTVNSHSHTMSHTHTVNSHSHSMSHTHSISSHTHSISGHTHSIASHTHTLSHTHTYGLRLGSYFNVFTSDVGSNKFSLYNGSSWTNSSTGSTDTANVPVLKPVAAETGTTSKNIYRPSLTTNTSAASTSTTSGTSLTTGSAGSGNTGGTSLTTGAASSSSTDTASPATGAASSSSTGTASPATNNVQALPPYFAVYMWERIA